MPAALAPIPFPSRPCHARPGTVALFPVLVLLTATVCSAAPEVMTILAKSSLAETTLSFSALRTLDLYRGGHFATQVKQSIARAPGGRERIETLSRGAYQGRLAISDGKVQWEYYPREKRCVRRPLPSLNQLGNSRARSLKRIAANLRPRVLGTEGLLGRSVYRVEILTPGGQRVRESWVDTANYLELRADCYQPDGVLSSRTYYTQIDFSHKNSNGGFSFKPPTGTKVQEVPPPAAKMPLAQAEEKAGFHAYLPTYLPSGYVLCDEETALLRNPERGLVLWVVFGNGLDSFSLFQTRCDGHSTEAACHGAQCWRVNDMMLTLVGQLGAKETGRVRASVAPR